MARSRNSILILGTRGDSASRDGFEAFAERYALFLVERGWDVSLYRRDDVDSVEERVKIEYWRGVRLIRVRTAGRGLMGALDFDWACARDAVKRPGLRLMLGARGAIFLPYQRLRGREVLTSLGTPGWKSASRGAAVRAWLWLNEAIAAWSSNRLVLDHPETAGRRPRSATVVIPPGGDPVERASARALREMGLEPGRYMISLANIAPGEGVHTLVEAFSRRPRRCKLVVLGDFNEDDAYHRRLKARASEDVLFPGALEDPHLVKALRFHARASLHGRTIGGANPALVEALWAGNAIIAHDDRFNRWTAADAGLYFADVEGCGNLISRVLADDVLTARLAKASRERARAAFRWSDALAAYERECLDVLGEPPASSISSAAGLHVSR